MEKVLTELQGKRIEVNCGRGIIFLGENQGSESGILKLKDDHGKMFLIDVAKVIAVCEASDTAVRPGFLGR